MRKPGTTSCQLIDWILVLALALAPFQSAWSAFDGRCQHQHAMQTAQPDSAPEHSSATHPARAAKCSHHLQSHNATGTSPASGDCCCHAQGNSDGNCSGNCQPLSAALYLLPLKLGFSVEFLNAFETQQPVFNNGRTVPPPHQPPRG